MIRNPRTLNVYGNADIPKFNPLSRFSALPGRDRLKGGNLLFDPRALAFGAPDFGRLVFGNGHDQGEPFFAFLTPEIITGHGTPPV